MDIAELLTWAQKTPADVSRRAGVARSTLFRAGRGDIEPRLSTLREIAFALGFTAKVTFEPASEPDAAAAARHLLLDEGLGDMKPSTQEWAERFGRWGLGSSDPKKLVAQAGLLSNPWLRAAHFVAGPDHLERDAPLLGASAASATRTAWAISGGWALRRLGELDYGSPTLVWVEDFESACDLAEESLDRTSVRVPGGVSIVAVTRGETDGRFIDGSLSFVAPLQLALDLCGGSFARAARAASSVALIQPGEDR